jgi:hypothetical protein
VFVARFVERRTAAPSALADPQEETAGLAAFLAGVSLADLASLMETAQQLCVPKAPSAKMPALVSPSQLQQREQREQQRQAEADVGELHGEALGQSARDGQRDGERREDGGEERIERQSAHRRIRN